VWWDFTGDDRGGSNSAVLVDQVHLRLTELKMMRTFDDRGGNAST